MPPLRSTVAFPQGEPPSLPTLISSWGEFGVGGGCGAGDPPSPLRPCHPHSAWQSPFPPAHRTPPPVLGQTQRWPPGHQALLNSQSGSHIISDLFLERTAFF